MPRTDVPDLDSPKFAPIRTRLARAFMEHKADLGVPEASDQDILDHVDHIMALMLRTTAAALACRSVDWFRHYSWFVDLVERLIGERGGKPLDS